jgi:hypothetical protein
MKKINIVSHGIILGLGLLAAMATANAYYSDGVDFPSGPVYSTGTVHNVPSGTPVEWVSGGQTHSFSGYYFAQVYINGGGLSISESGPDINGIDMSTQSGNIDYTIYVGGSDASAWLDVYFEW